ncbi:hypothetical protein Nmel_000512 [Mimus melanotis]
MVLYGELAKITYSFNCGKQDGIKRGCRGETSSPDTGVPRYRSARYLRGGGRAGFGLRSSCDSDP